MKHKGLLVAAVLLGLSSIGLNAQANADGTTNAKNDKVKVAPVKGVTKDTIRGVDVSSLQAELNAGVKYYNYKGEQQDIMQTLEDAGVNYVRLRILNDPYDKDGHSYGAGDSTLANAIKTGKDATKHHMKVLIDLQYSDFWADPAKQAVPKAWKNYTFEQKKQAVHDYTKKVMLAMADADVNVGMVQVGNETSRGMLQESDPAKYMQYLAEGVNAVHKYAPNALAAVHYESPTAASFDKIAGELKANKVDYDVMGATFYPHWNGPDDKLSGAEQVITKKYGKKFAVMEMSYPYTTDDMDGQPNIVGDIKNPPFKISVQGQSDSISDVWKTVMQNGNGKALGAFYWEPAWIPVKAGWNNYQYNRDMDVKYGTGWATKYAANYYGDAGYAGQKANVDAYWGASSYDNQALFDPNGNPLQSLLTFKQMMGKSITKEKGKVANYYKVKKASVSAKAYDLNGSKSNFTFKTAFNLRDVKSKYLKVDKRAYVARTNGKTYLYYHVKSGKNEGWVWHKYLKRLDNKVTKKTKMKAKSYRVTNGKKSKGAVYQLKGSSKNFQFVKKHNLKNYAKTRLIATKKAHITKYNGKKYLYYYVHSSNNKVKGYVWHKYLK